jgi:hypothetical protein
VPGGPGSWRHYLGAGHPSPRQQRTHHHLHHARYGPDCLVSLKGLRRDRSEEEGADALWCVVVCCVVLMPVVCGVVCGGAGVIILTVMAVGSFMPASLRALGLDTSVTTDIGEIEGIREPEGTCDPDPLFPPFLSSVGSSCPFCSVRFAVPFFLASFCWFGPWSVLSFSPLLDRRRLAFSSLGQRAVSVMPSRCTRRPSGTFWRWARGPWESRARPPPPPAAARARRYSRGTATATAAAAAADRPPPRESPRRT